MHFIVNFGQFSDRFLFGPVFGQKSQNRTLSEKSDGLAALLMERPPSTAISLGMLQTSFPVFLTLDAVWTYWCSDYRHGLFIMNVDSLLWSLEAV